MRRSAGHQDRAGDAEDARSTSLLVERGLAPSRERARALILAGQVTRRRPGRLEGRARRSRPTRGVELVDARSSVRRPRRRQAGARARRVRASIRADAARSTSAPRPAASPTSCCSAAPPASSRSTSATASSTGGCAAIRASLVREGVNARALTPDDVPHPVEPRDDRRRRSSRCGTSCRRCRRSSRRAPTSSRS